MRSSREHNDGGSTRRGAILEKLDQRALRKDNPCIIPVQHAWLELSAHRHGIENSVVDLDWLPSLSLCSSRTGQTV